MRQKIFVIVRRSVYITLGRINNVIYPTRPSIIVLCYHSISDDAWRFSVSAQTFRSQLDILSRTYDFWTTDDIAL